MFKLIVLCSVLAMAAAKPGALLAAPIAPAAQVAYSPIASASLAYSPLAYSPIGYQGQQIYKTYSPYYPAPYTYSSPYGYATYVH